MTKSKKKIGFFGENLTAHFLRAKGFEILDNNFCLQGGEIDLIAKDKKEIVFVEVKTRFNDIFGDPLDSMSEYKFKKLVYSAQVYLMKNNLDDFDYRIDFVGINFAEGKMAIEHIEDIF